MRTYVKPSMHIENFKVDSFCVGNCGEKLSRYGVEKAITVRCIATTEQEGVFNEFSNEAYNAGCQYMATNLVVVSGTYRYKDAKTAATDLAQDGIVGNGDTSPNGAYTLPEGTYLTWGNSKQYWHAGEVSGSMLESMVLHS